MAGDNLGFGCDRVCGAWVCDDEGCRSDGEGCDGDGRGDELRGASCVV